MPVLGLVQILGWGSTYYAPALVAPHIAAELGWSLTFAVSGVTIGLIVAGLCSPVSTRLVQRFGGHVAIPVGALITALGLLSLAFVTTETAYVGVWIWLGIGMSLVLSDPSYVALALIFRGQARKPMVLISMMAGLAGSISWLSTYLLMQGGSWRTPFLVYAALFALVAVPLVALVLPRPDAVPAKAAQPSSPGVITGWAPRGRPLWLQFAGFSAYAFTISATLTHFIPMTQRSGIDTGLAVAMAMLLGPMQLAVRLFELLFGQRFHPLLITRFAVVTFLVGFAIVLVAGFSIPTTILFVLLMGIANGVMTIARGVLPLALFGHDGYPQAAGILAFANLGSQAAGPLVLAIVIERGSDFAALAMLAGFVVIAIVCFALLRRPAPQ
ncbi:MAG TPA: MFS transporter [Devosia sp.]|nr:MFS transporter [Devosia sp.]